MDALQIRIQAIRGLNSKSLTALLCALMALPLGISATFMGFYWSLYSDAAKVNEEESIPGYDNPFDVCGLVSFNAQGGVVEIADTKWTLVFMLNAVVYTVLSSCMLFIALSGMAPLFLLAFPGICCTWSA